jgi:Mn-containing catalase
MAWVTNYNQYIIKSYSEKTREKSDELLDDIGVEEVVDIEFEEEVA